MLADIDVRGVEQLADELGERALPVEHDDAVAPAAIDGPMVASVPAERIETMLKGIPLDVNGGMLMR